MIPTTAFNFHLRCWWLDFFFPALPIYPIYIHILYALDESEHRLGLHYTTKKNIVTSDSVKLEIKNITNTRQLNVKWCVQISKQLKIGEATHKHTCALYDRKSGWQRGNINLNVWCIPIDYNRFRCLFAIATRCCMDLSTQQTWVREWGSKCLFYGAPWPFSIGRKFIWHHISDDGPTKIKFWKKKKRVRTVYEGRMTKMNWPLYWIQSNWNQIESKSEKEKVTFCQTAACSE